MSNSECNFQPCPNVIYTQLDDSEAALMDMETKRFYSLNETGLFIWNFLQEGMRASDISEALQEEYDINKEQATDCVLGFLNELMEQKLIERIES